MVHLLTWRSSLLRNMDCLVGEWLGRSWLGRLGSGKKWMSRVVEVECYLVKVATDHIIVSVLRPKDQHEDTNIQLNRKFATLEGIRILPNDPDPLHVFSMPEWYALDVGLEYFP